MSLNFNIVSRLEGAGFKDAASYLRGLTAETHVNKKANEEQAVSVEGIQSAYKAFMALAIVEYLREASNAAMENRQQQQQLAQRVEQTGLSYQRAKPQLDAFFQSLEQQTGIARGKLVPALDVLIDKTHDVRKSQELMLTTLGLAKMRNLELAQAADLVAGVYKGEDRAIGQVGRALGLTETQMRDHDQVMKILSDRAVKFTENLDKTAISIGKVSIEWDGLKEDVGDSDIFKSMYEGLASGLNQFRIFFTSIGIMATTTVNTLGATWNAIKNFFKGDDFVYFFKEQMTKIQAESDIAFAELSKKMLGHQDEGKDLAKTYVDPIKKAFEDLNNEELKLIAQGQAAVNGSMQERLESRMALIDLEIQQEKQKLRQQDDWKYLRAKDQNKLLLAVEQQGLAAKAKLWEQENRWKIDIFMQGAVQMGRALGATLAGEQDAWKKSLVAVIDMVAQQVEAIIAANTARDVSFLPGGLANPAAWGIIAQGVGQEALVAGLAAAATSAIGGGGGGGGGALSSGGSSSSGGSYGSYGGGPAAAAAPTAPGQTLIINLHGQIYGDRLVVQRIADEISNAVLNNGVRLVATQVMGRTTG